jgi:hypothetical protein
MGQQPTKTLHNNTETPKDSTLNDISIAVSCETPEHNVVLEDLSALKELLNNDLELLILSYCDIITVVRYGYCNLEKYELVNKSQWLWKQHTLAELGDEHEHPKNVQDWKQEFIDIITVQIDLSMNPTECIGKCFSVDKRKVSREKVDSMHHAWERLLGKRKIKPKTITMIEFLIDEHFVYTGNAFRVCVGAVSKNFWKHENDFGNIIGLNEGYCVIVGSAQTYVCGLYNEINCSPIVSGDIISFLMDNGYTKNSVSVEVFINKKKVTDLNYSHLPVTEYRAAMSLCQGQSASIKKVVTLKSKTR